MRPLPALAVATAALVAPALLAGCGGDDDTAPGAAETVTVTAEPTPEETGTTEEPSPSPPTADGEVPAEYDGVLAAVALAEDEAGGPAFEVDDGDGGIWEVHVAVGEDDIEVQVSGDGSEVLSSEREADLGADDAAGLEADGIGLAEAIRRGVQEYGGTAPLDDAGVSSEADGTYAWEVAFTDDIEVYLRIEDGAVLRVES